MKKLFISCPMRGRTPEAIKASIEKMHKIAEATVGEELEIIPTYLEGAEYQNRPIACLGESIKRMQEADYFAHIDDTWGFTGCEIETRVARAYGIKTIIMPTLFVCHDIEEIVSKAVCAEIASS